MVDLDPTGRPRRSKFLFPALLLLAFASGCLNRSFLPDRAVGFTAREMAGHRHYVYAPAGSPPEKGWPVVLWLHGGGEMGDDGTQPAQVGPGPIVGEAGGAFPFIVVFPQCPRGRFWTEPDVMARVTAALDDAIARHGGDPERVILTGHSMGGFGTWIMAARLPDRFAALVPIAGGVRPPRGKVPEDPLFGPGEDPELAVARAVAHLPVWIFHGGSDWLVPASGARRMEAHVKAAGGDVRLTIFSGVGHGSDEPAYRMAELWTWAAAQRRRARPPSAP